MTMKTTKYVFYKWAFYLLLLTMLSAVVSTVMLSRKQKQDEKLKSEVTPRETGWGRYYREQLGLNNEQHIRFREYRQQFHSDAYVISVQMEDIRGEILKELARNKSDTLKLNNLTVELGSLHTELKQLSNAYFLSMKNICNREQQLKLVAIFRLMNKGDFTGPPKFKQKTGADSAKKQLSKR